MLYFRQFLMLLFLLSVSCSVAKAIDPFSAFLIGKGTDAALDLIFSDKNPSPSAQREKILGAGTFTNGAWELTFGSDAEKSALAMIGSSQKSILVITSSLKSPAMAKALKKAADKGVKVLIISGRQGGRDYAVNLHRMGIPVRLQKGELGLEFMVIDGKSAQTGIPGHGNGVLCLKNTPDLAKVYARKWKQIWDLSSNPKK